MNHTQGKVKYQEESDAYTHIIRGDGGRMIAYAPQGSNGTDEANTRRLVACWNLLLPFTTEEIEAGVDMAKLVQERDELFELAVLMNATFEDVWIEYEQSGLKKHVESILAKYEEGK